MTLAERVSVEPGTCSDESVVNSILANGRVRDLALLALVPVVLVAVFSLPTGLREAYALEYLHPTAVTAYTAHFVHLSTGHLLANIGGYVAVVAIACGLCLSGDRRVESFIAFATFLLALPFVLSVLNVLIARPRIGFGFSGVVMVFTGFLPLPLFWHLEARLEAGPSAVHAPGLFFVGTAGIATMVAPVGPARTGVIAVAVLCAVTYLVSVINVVRGSLPETLRGRLMSVGTAELVVAALVLFVAFPVAAFPTDPAVGRTIPNVYTHFLGYAFGFIVPFVALVVVEWSTTVRRSTAT